MEKDYSLLRPFDLEAANNKAPICWPCQGVEIMFVGMASDNKAVIEYFAERQVQKVWPTDLRMAPLAWVEGRPVYRGDTVYTTEGRAVVVNNTYREYAVTDGEWVVECRAATWQKPKTKREGWVNLSTRYTCSTPYDTKEEADFGVNESMRIACIRIEWEE